MAALPHTSTPTTYGEHESAMQAYLKAGEARGAARALTRAPHAAAPAAGSIGATFDDSAWRAVDLPHD